MKDLLHAARRMSVTIGALFGRVPQAFFCRARANLDLPPRPSFRGGIPRIDIADRAALEEIL